MAYYSYTILFLCPQFNKLFYSDHVSVLFVKFTAPKHFHFVSFAGQLSLEYDKNLVHASHQ